jgi:protein-disulfide isomerase
MRLAVYLKALCCNTRDVRWSAFVSCLILVPALAGPNHAAQAQRSSTEVDTSTAATSVGITRTQADEILSELRQIRQLLERNGPSGSNAVPVPEAIQMNVSNSWRSIGDDSAQVTIVEFTDLECSYCRQFHDQTFPKIKQEYIDTGKVRFVSRDLPLPVHANAKTAAEAVRCAGDQNKYWELRNALLETNGPLSRNAIVDAANKVGIDGAILSACLDSTKYRRDVEMDVNDAASLQIRSTPSFVIARTSRDMLVGTRLTGAKGYPVFQSRIAELLR